VLCKTAMKSYISMLQVTDSVALLVTFYVRHCGPIWKQFSGLSCLSRIGCVKMVACYMVPTNFHESILYICLPVCKTSTGVSGSWYDVQGMNALLVDQAYIFVGAATSFRAFRPDLTGDESLLLQPSEND
jgi:hypothetical protein